MSLQVWLPLNGNLDNQGLNDIPIVNNGATIDDKGKIGKCYSFDGSNDRISDTVARDYSYPLSVAAWIKPTNVAGGIQYIISIDTDTDGFSGHIIALAIYSDGNLCIGAGGRKYNYQPLTNDTWYHIAGTITEDKVYSLYVNGVLVKTDTCGNAPASKWLTIGARSNSSTGGAGGAGYYFKGCINDVRIYDHALSAKEVKELSKGLVLHYPLSNNGCGLIDYGENLEYDVSGYNNHGTKTGTITYTSDTARYSVASHFINGSYIMANKNSSDYLPTDSITVNLWIRCTTWGNPISCTENYGFNFENSSSGVRFAIYLNGIGYSYASGIPVNDLRDGKWHMMTGVYDRINQIIYLYLDAQLIKSTAIGSSAVIKYASNRLIISGEAETTTPASSTFVGEESDVRIYATALSAEDIVELYNTAASLSNNGTLFAYEYVEA